MLFKGILFSNQSFHKKGKRITANTTTSKSSRKMRPAICRRAPSLKTSAKADWLSRINSNKIGRITGKPSMAISAAFCCALAAMALIKVNTKLMLVPPNITMPVKRRASFTGLLKNIKNKQRLTILISAMSKVLKRSLATINSTGDVIE